MNDFQTLIEHNVLCLEQGIDLLHTLSDADYVAIRPPVYESTIGDHMRHNLEHYICFVQAYATGAIDYDARKRDRRIATDRDHAVAVARALIDHLRSLPEDRILRVKVDSSGEEDNRAIWSTSTGVRDLQYLQAHTIHHYALISFMVRFQGGTVSEAFGVAPSTIAYRRQMAIPYT